MKDAEQGSLGKREGCPRREIGEENMVFSNLFFIYLFLPLNLILYFVVKNRTWQNIVLLGFSLFFYAWGTRRSSGDDRQKFSPTRTVPLGSRSSWARSWRRRRSRSWFSRT